MIQFDILFFCLLTTHFNREKEEEKPRNKTGTATTTKATKESCITKREGGR